MNAESSETGRLEALTDGVFAIVMTLLVFELSLPVVTGAMEGTALAEELLGQWPSYISYAVSFVILSLFWMRHRDLLLHIKRVDGRLMWLNLLFLMFIALMPFSSSLVAAYWGHPISAVVYGFNWLLPFATSVALFSYGYGSAGLASGVDPTFVRREQLASAIVSAAIIGGIALSFISSTAPFLVYGSLAAFYIITSCLGRGGISVSRIERDDNSGTDPGSGRGD